MTDKPEEIADSLISGIEEIANSPNFVKGCEPNIFQPQKIHKWMIIRVLTAREMIAEKMQEEADHRRDMIEDR